MRIKFPAVLIILFVSAGFSIGQTTEFTYQGRLLDGTLPANAGYDLEFKLFDAENGGTEIGTQTRNGVAVVNGIFTVTLDFGAQFPGANRWLEISVKAAGGPAFTPLTPRQPITSAPYNIRSASAADADTLGGIPVNGFVQNSTSQQTANFNISGDGTIGGNLTIAGSFSANILNAATQFNIGGNRVLSVDGSQNVVVGQNAGTNNTGFGNAFVGHFAGNANTTGSNNSFFGTDSGRNNTGSANSFFGRSAGFDNTTGSSNSFFGLDSGRFNTEGNNNSFFGRMSGNQNTTGTNNNFFGVFSGRMNTTGGGNAFYGQASGEQNITGSSNSIFGVEAGRYGQAGDNNAFFGADAGQQNQASGNSFFGRSAGFANTTGASNSFFGIDSGRFNTTGTNNSFFGTGAGMNSLTGNSHAFFGAQAGGNNVTGFANTLMGTNAEVGAPDLQFATAIGANSLVTASNTIALGRSGGQDTVQIPGNLTVAGTLTADLPANDGDYIQNRTTVQTTSNFNISGTGTANILNASAQYNLGGDRVLDATSGSTLVGISSGAANTAGTSTFFGFQAGNANTTGSFNAFFGRQSGMSNVTGQQNSFFGDGAGALNTAGNNSFFGFLSGSDTTTGAGNAYVGAFAGGLSTTGGFNTFVGYFTGAENRAGSNNTLVGANADLGSNSLSFATAIGAGAVVTTNSTVVLGRASDDVRVPGNLVIPTLGSAGSLDLCRNASNQISTCSSSLRYKNEITDFTRGLDVVRRLRPISFRWNNSDIADVGFGAEEVNVIEPFLTTRNDKGEIEGVRYAQITTVLVNAVNEQQRTIERQQQQIDELKKIVCLSHPQAEICK
jgi:hypothetical protein